MINKTILNEWQEAINDMSYEELQRSLEDPSFYQEYKYLVKNRMAEVEKEMAHVQEVFLKTLKNRRYKYELGEDQNVFFIKHERQRFRADLYCEDNFVGITFIHDVFIDKEDTAKLSRLKEAVNETNKICGVSTATVSNVIHGKFKKVSPEVRERIELAIKENGYVPNQSALSLVRTRSDMIGIVVADKMGSREGGQYRHCGS